MSHQDAVIKLPKGFKKLASTKNSKLTIIGNEIYKVYGVQFHPEVTHTKNGIQLFKNFLFLICRVKKEWKVGEEKKELLIILRKP